MPGTAIGFAVATLAIAGVPPFAGFWAKDDAISSAFFGHDYVVYAIGLSAALLTALYMTREVLLVFYGNERFHPPVGRAAVADASVDAAEEPVAVVPDEHGLDLTASPTVDYGTPPVRPCARGDPHEGTGIMVAAGPACSAFLAIVGGLLDLPFTEARVPDPLPRARVRDASPRPSPPASGRRSGSTSLAVDRRARRHPDRVADLPRGSRGSGRRPARPAARCPRPAVRTRLVLRRGHRGRGRRADPARRAVARRRVRPEDHRRRGQRHRPGLRRRGHAGTQGADGSGAPVRARRSRSAPWRC